MHQRFETDADAEIGLPAESYGHERDAGEQRAETPLKALDHRARHAVEGMVDDPPMLLGSYRRPETEARIEAQAALPDDLPDGLFIRIGKHGGRMAASGRSMRLRMCRATRGETP